MFGSNIVLSHQISEARHRDFLAEAERQRRVADALDARRQPRPRGFTAARISLATLLLRAGSRLMRRTPRHPPAASGSSRDSSGYGLSAIGYGTILVLTDSPTHRLTD